MMKYIYFLLIINLSLYAASSDEIIKQLEDNLNGKTAKLNITMTVETSRATRTMKMSSFSIGDKKSFIKILYPRKDKGITFLKVDHLLWQYVPRIERVIKIPSSMMLQSWMGSDFSNDDLVKESSISQDYHTKLLSETKDKYLIELIAKDDATVVWGKLLMEVSKKYILPLNVKYYDEDDVLIRTLSYEKIKKFENKYYPTYWQMIPKTEDKKGHKTIIQIDKAVFDKEISESYFTKNALKRYSR